jgi:ubiquinone/menaquinone biosynthesis C-methylase UbiE
MDDEILRHARSFGSVADAYDRGRPSFPPKAAAWLVGRDSATVLEVGAGTGKLTQQLVALGHDVHATEPDADMLAVLERELPATRATQAPAEELPVQDGSVDVVVAAQSFHWFDHERALAEFARVLRPGGHVALVWNYRDERIPWVRRLGRLIGSQDQITSETAEPLVLAEQFGYVEEAEFPHWQQINRASLQDLVLSRSNIATLDESERAARLAEVVAFYDDFGRGYDGMQLPYVARCFRAQLLSRPGERGGEPGAPDGDGPADPPTDPPGDGRDGGDSDLLLIDFR